MKELLMYLRTGDNNIEINCIFFLIRYYSCIAVRFLQNSLFKQF